MSTKIASFLFWPIVSFSCCTVRKVSYFHFISSCLCYLPLFYILPFCSRLALCFCTSVCMLSFWGFLNFWSCFLTVSIYSFINPARWNFFIKHLFIHISTWSTQSPGFKSYWGCTGWMDGLWTMLRCFTDNCQLFVSKYIFYTQWNHHTEEDLVTMMLVSPTCTAMCQNLSNDMNDLLNILISCLLITVPLKFKKGHPCNKIHMTKIPKSSRKYASVR